MGPLLPLFWTSDVHRGKGSLYDVTSSLVGGSLSLVPCSFRGKSVSGPMFLPEGGGLSGGVYLADTPLDRDPPSTETLPGQRHPWAETPPDGKECAVRILLECILVCK